MLNVSKVGRGPRDLLDNITVEDVISSLVKDSSVFSKLLIV